MGQLPKFNTENEDSFFRSRTVVLEQVCGTTLRQLGNLVKIRLTLAPFYYFSGLETTEL